MSNNFRRDPSIDKVHLLPYDDAHNKMNTNSPAVFSAHCSNGIVLNDVSPIIQLPVLHVNPRKIIVPLNHLSQPSTTNGPSIKRYSNGDNKVSHSYRSAISENPALNSPQTLLINTSSVGKPTLTVHAGGSNSTMTHAIPNSVRCHNCGILNRLSSHCESCKRPLATISVIRPVRNPASILCTNTNSISNVTSTKTITTVKTTTPIRTRPTIIAGSKNSVTINRKTFYGEKSKETQDLCPLSPLLYAPNLTIEARPAITSTVTKQSRIRKQPAKRNLEPVCLTLSSDDEEASSQESAIATSSDIPSSSNSNLLNVKQDLQSSQDTVSSTVGPSNGDQSGDIEQTSNLEETSVLEDGQISSQEIGDGIRLMCRSIRIGSYKIQSPDPPSLALDITKNLIQFSVPGVDKNEELIEINVERSDLVSILACFEKRLFVLFLYTTAECGSLIRTQLKMNSDTFYYDPSSPEETKKRITILPGSISDADKTYLRYVFQKPKMVELSQSKANEILVKSTPVGPGGNQHIIKLSQPIITRSKAESTAENFLPKNEVVKLAIYPPPPQTGGITITSEDLLCLEEGEYLNDVIIDFYLKYIYLEKLSKHDQERTHIFSSFFFNRLTQSSAKGTAKNSKMSQKELRHSRVKTWTRHVDIFDKDFLIVPVNQSSHWFLVVICFPGKVSADYIPVTKVKKEIKAESETKNNSDESPTQSDRVTNSQENNLEDSKTLITSVKPLVPYSLDDEINEDSSLGSCNELLGKEQDCDIKTVSQISTVSNINHHDYAKVKEEGAKLDSSADTKQIPCIMVFDSLPGTSRWRVVASLREYLEVEHQVKKSFIKHFDRESMKGLNTRVSRQSNFSDCGVYLLQYAESFYENPLDSFAMPLKDLTNWFSPETIKCKRESIKNLILELSGRK